METARLAIAQIEAPYFAKKENEEKIRHFIEQALDAGVDLLLFPEAVNLGYFILDQTRSKDEALSLALQMAPSLSSPWVEEMKRQAQRGIYLAVGCIIKIARDKLANTLLLISPGGEVFTYHKTHLYHVREIREENFVVEGNGLSVFETALGKLGLCICYDLTFPEVARTLALQGARIILVPAAWPKASGAKWDRLLPARALENEAFILACNQTGGEYYGHSRIIDYAGETLTESEAEESLKVVEVDLARQKKWRETVTYFKDRRPELYHG